jgi:hypothetical protein
MSGPKVTPQGGAPRLLADPEAEFNFLFALGKTYYRCGDVGRLLRIAGQIRPGEAESGYQAFHTAATDARVIAQDSAERGHRVSAREAYLWAANYGFTSTYFLDASHDPSRWLPTWREARECWDRAAALFDPPVEQVRIPYEGTTLAGYLFRVDGSGKRRPLLILINGSDGSVLDMWALGGAAGVARGYNCLTFDGPGQGACLWLQQLYFRPDWEKVITPVVDFALGLPEVDPDRIALQGISQGGYWAPRAVAFEHRVAAAIADPGVVDVATSWTVQLPAELMELLRAGRKEEFDQAMDTGLAEYPAMRAALAFRMRPYGTPSPYEAYRAAMAHNLERVAGDIRCPMLITDPEGEQFWPGQSRQLYNLLTCPKTLVSFTAAEGADLHCEPKAPGLRDLRAFDWLDETLGHSPG